MKTGVQLSPHDDAHEAVDAFFADYPGEIWGAAEPAPVEVLSGSQLSGPLVGTQAQVQLTLEALGAWVSRAPERLSLFGPRPRHPALRKPKRGRTGGRGPGVGCGDNGGVRCYYDMVVYTFPLALYYNLWYYLPIVCALVTEPLDDLAAKSGPLLAAKSSNGLATSRCVTKPLERSDKSVMSKPTRLKVHYGVSMVREGLYGVDLSGFQQVSMGFLEGCRHRGYECVLLVQACPKGVIGSPADGYRRVGGSSSGAQRVVHEEDAMDDVVDAEEDEVTDVAEAEEDAVTHVVEAEEEYRCHAPHAQPSAQADAGEHVDSIRMFQVIKSNQEQYTVVCEQAREIVKKTDLEAKHIVVAIEQKFKYKISYAKAWCAKQKALERKFGSFEVAYDNLPRMLQVLQDRNPATYIAVKDKPSKRPSLGFMILQRTFLAFGPYIDAFRHMLPVISVDKTFLTRKYKGMILIAIGIDGDN
uniref:PH01B001G05.17 protein n=1 Tax=Phyllostachys edulis TaxID=38705 RepID=L0P1J9_PHYED|nr:PH01B001G05.17 [Phyllostachys edulis]